MKISKGITRVVLDIGSFVIKFPRPSSHYNFLQGMVANWRERKFCKDFKDLPEFIDLVAPSLWCSWFGLCQIQRRVEVNHTPLTEEEFERFNSLGLTDTKPENFGYYKGKLVALDY